MRLVVLAVLLAMTSCQAEHECQNPKEITEDFTPVFDFGDNWSFENCGLWSNREVAAPWRIAVSRTDGATCVGILLSNYDFVTSKCKEVADDFLKAPNGVKAYTGTCYDQKVKSTDAPTAECTGLEVKGVAALGKDSDGTQLHLWRLKAAVPDTTPICLFNSNRKQRGGYGDSDYAVVDRKWKGRVEAKVVGAPRSSQTSKVCVKISSGQTTEGEQDFSGDFLVKEVRGRMTLRGFFFWPVAEHKIFVYTDVVPFIKQLVANSYNMFIMPQVPPPKTKTDFSKAPTLNKKGVCGLMQPVMRRIGRSSHYIIHSVQAKGFSSTPWHATVSYRPKDIYLPEILDFCGATLISNRVVLTAAHCLYKVDYQHNASTLLIALGMHNASAEFTSNQQLISVERIVMHPEYNRNTKLYDVALLFLKEEANLTAHVRPICLWDDDYSMDILKGENGTVVGFGETEDEATMRRQKSDILQEGHLPVLDHNECYMKEKVFYRKYLQPGVTFCAGGINMGAQSQRFLMSGSVGGGGLVFRKDNAWFLRGVVSFSIQKLIYEDGESIASHNNDYPSMFVDLGSCMEWIVQQVAQYVPLAPTNH